MHFFFVFINRMLPGQMVTSLDILLGEYCKATLEKLQTVDIVFTEV